MGLVIHRFDEMAKISSTSTADLYIGTKEITESVIIPTLEQYDNIMLLGAYEEETTKKYVLDIGYDNIALFLYVNGRYISTGVCKKSDINNLTYLDCNPNASGVEYRMQTNPSTISSGNMTEYYATLNGAIRIIAHNNVAKVVFALTQEAKIPAYIIMLDEDNFGNRYVAYRTGLNTTSFYLYYDTDDFVKGSIQTNTIQNTLDMKVLKHKMILTKNSILSGVSTNLMDIHNDTIQTTFTLIDVDGVKYRNINGYRWYRED